MQVPPLLGAGRRAATASAPLLRRGGIAWRCFCCRGAEGGTQQRGLATASAVASSRPLGPFPLAARRTGGADAAGGGAAAAAAASAAWPAAVVPPGGSRSGPPQRPQVLDRDGPVLPCTAALAVQQFAQQAAELAAPTSELRALVVGLEASTPPEAYRWMLETVAQLESQQRDRAALMKRSWSDSPFEEGEARNEEVIEGFELELVGMLRSSPKGLGDGQILGNAIDLAGAYKKNYKLEKSEAVLLRCTRHAEERSGAWMVKYLNHISQVRMKQSRDVEAMEMMYEIESLANFPMDEPGASTFYETLYRNMSSGLRRMAREDEAAVYFMKMVEASQYHKPRLDWMDLWDLGLLIANRSYQTQRWPEFYKAREILAEALRQQKAVEPHELILRAKVLSNLGQCFLATGEHAEADVHYSEAYDLFRSCVGHRSPLFGMQAWACGNLRQAEGRHEEALPMFGEALYVEVVKDGLSVSEMMKLLDQIISSAHEARQTGHGELRVEPIERALATLVEDPRWHRLADSLDLAVLCHKMALFHVAVSGGTATAPHWAASLSERAVRLLRQASGREAAPWLAQAEAIRGVLLGSGTQRLGGGRAGGDRAPVGRT